METTMVLSIRSLTTRPIRVFLRLRVVVAVAVVIRLHSSFERRGREGRDSRLLLAILLGEHGQEPGDLAPSPSDLERVVELLHRVVEAQVEQLLAQLADPQLQLLRALLPNRRHLHSRHVTLLPARGGPRSAS